MAFPHLFDMFPGRPKSHGIAFTGKKVYRNSSGRPHAKRSQGTETDGKCNGWW